MSKAGSLVRNLAIACLAVLVTLLVAEGILSFFWANPYRIELPDAVLEIPAQHAHADRTFERTRLDCVHSTVRFRTDGRAYIAPSLRYKEPDATIVFMGGSTTECSAVQESLRFPALTSDLLAARGLRVNTLNAGRSGNTMQDALNLLLNHVVQDSPDIIVLMHATNDGGLLAHEAGYASRMGHPVTCGDLGRWLVQKLSTRSRLTALLRRGIERTDFTTRTREKSDRIVDLPYQQYEMRLRAFVHLCRDFGITPVLTTQPLTSCRNELTPAWADLALQDRLNATIRAVGREEEVLVLDLITHLQKELPDWDTPMKYFYDGMHVTDRGSEIYAAFFADALYPLLVR